MASTRSKTGNSKPRVFPAADTTTPAARKPATKKSGTKAKANTSKPRAKKVAADKVAKVKKIAKKAAPKPKKESAPVRHQPSLLEKVGGALLKVEGALLGKPGKKAAGTAKIKGTAKKPAAKK